MQGGRLSGSRLFSRTYLQFFCSNFEGLFDAGSWRRGPVTLAQNGLRSSSFYARYLLLVWLWAGPVYQGEAGFAKSPTQENNLRKRRLGTIMLSCKADISYDHTSYILNVNLGNMEQFWKMLTICLVKLILILFDYKVKVNFYNELIYHWMFLGKSRIKYISLGPFGKKNKNKKRKNTRLTLIRLT